MNRIIVISFLLVGLFLTITCRDHFSNRIPDIHDQFSNGWVCKHTGRLCGPYPLKKIGFGEVHKYLLKKVAGHRTIIKNILESLEYHFTDISDSPLVLYFFGETGTGKTYLSELLGKVLYTNRNALLKFDCGTSANESTEVIYELIKYHFTKFPRGAILFDEAEQCNLLFRKLHYFLDSGSIMIKKKTYHFPHALIILASNYPCHVIVDKDRDDPKWYEFETMRAELFEPLSKLYPGPPFVNRISRFLPFFPTTRKELIEVAGIQLETFKERIEGNWLAEFNYSYEIIEFLGSIADPKLNGGGVTKLIESKIMQKLLHMRGEIYDRFDSMSIHYNNDTLYIYKTTENTQDSNSDTDEL
ncbi:atp-dependent clp protease [Anaeramoeba flamelloides]|uniref:Atp-dependent clp protease n=1 Tax=Anaeramoeba flamelloides TaxID=1746091 RepID=A0ABQ8Z3V3_9EUKA|nr:atp-dependent clp protease [Anaeramoeba flamelloides]